MDVDRKPSAVLPEALLTWGRVVVADGAALVAGERATLEVAIVLARALPAGYRVEAWTHFVSDLQRPQCDDPAAPAHFSCSATGEGTGPAVAPFALPEAAVHGPGTFFPYRRYAGIRLLEPAPAGARFGVRLRDAAVQTYEEPLFNLRFAVLDGAEGLVGYLGDACYEVIGGPAHALRVVGPTCVDVGRPFRCAVVVCDRFGNKTAAPLEGLRFDLRLDRHAWAAGEEGAAGDATPAQAVGAAPGGPGGAGEPGGAREPGGAGEVARYDAARRCHVVEGVCCPAEGVYALHAALAVPPGAPPVAGESNPLVARERWTERVYWGDLHQHSYHDDGRGVPAASYAYARSTSFLDFCAVTPHQESVLGPPLHRLGGPPQRAWEELIAAAEAGAEPDLVTFLGSEASSLAPLAGHMNAYYLDHGNRPEFERLGLRPPPGGGRYPIESYAQYLAVLEQSRGEVLLLPHAHAGGGPDRFDLPHRPAYQTSVEICSLHGVFEEFYRRWLRHGHLVGVHGGGDNHMTSAGNANPGFHYPNTNGLAAVYAAGKTRPSIWRGIRGRRTYAATANRRIFLELSVDGHPMGAVAPRPAGAGDAPGRTVRVEAAGTAPVLSIALFRGDELVRVYRPRPGRRRLLRLVWTDSFGSRRVDDSRTTGRIAVPGGRLRLLAALNAFTRTDAFVEEDGAIRFRTNGYSGITRGVLLEAPAAAGALRFSVLDRHLGETLLEAELEVPLRDGHARITRPLRVDPTLPRWRLFSPEPVLPEFDLQADWADPDWPRAVRLRWNGVRAEATAGAGDTAPASAPAPLGDRGAGRHDEYYFVRLEQLDGAVAWSSPVWFR